MARSRSPPRPTATRRAGPPPVPAAFAGAPVRFQAGDYQQADSAGGGAGGDGARLTFHALSVGP